MFKSIFLKQLTTFGTIILLSFVLLISIITSIVSSYSLSQNTESVKWSATAAKTTFEEWLKMDEDGSFLQMISENRKTSRKYRTPSFFARIK
jgi:hypothetical protein